MADCVTASAIAASLLHQQDLDGRLDAPRALADASVRSTTAWMTSVGFYVTPVLRRSPARGERLRRAGPARRLRGHLRVDSPADGGTLAAAEIPSP
jgi:hypothetical protein